MDTSAKVKRRYDRNSRFYELYESPMERMMFGGLRRKLFEKVNADNPKTIIEIGLGTGKNLPYYAGQRVTGIDISNKMLEKARLKERRLKTKADLRVGDAQALPFADGSFDAALATFVFCSVPDPVKGLREVKRVVKNGGKIYLMEHVRPTRSRLLAVLFDLFDPIFSRLTGAHINRNTVSNVEKAGFEIITRYEGPGGILQMVEAVRGKKERAQ